MNRSRENNSNWKGGEIITPHGYRTILVGEEHHLADPKGYAYEHRMVAEKKIGRRLRDKEIAHHINGDKLDNRPENIEVLDGNAEHFFVHRKEGSKRRDPGEPNPLVLCACCCGSEFPKFDISGRPRVYVSGHNHHPSPTMDAIISSLEDGPLNRKEIARLCNKTLSNIAVALSRMKRRGTIFQISHGVWAIKRVDNR